MKQHRCHRYQWCASHARTSHASFRNRSLRWNYVAPAAVLAFLARWSSLVEIHNTPPQSPRLDEFGNANNEKSTIQKLQLSSKEWSSLQWCESKTHKPYQNFNYKPDLTDTVYWISNTEYTGCTYSISNKPYFRKQYSSRCLVWQEEGAGTRQRGRNCGWCRRIRQQI